MMGELTAAAMVEEAKGRIENLTPEEVAKEIEGGALMVDIREEAEIRSEGRIPDAVSAPRGMLEFFVDSTSPYHRDEFDTDRRIVLYCSSGGRSALGADTMRRMGYRQVAPPRRRIYGLEGAGTSHRARRMKELGSVAQAEPKRGPAT